jgi:phosphonate transport system substrate-binding protein
MNILRRSLLGACLTLVATFSLASDAPLTFGVFPYVSRGQLMDFHTPLKVYLESRLKRPVDLVTAPDFAEFANRTQKGEYDLILTAPHMGRLAERRDGYVRLVKTGHEVQAVFLVRRDSGLRKLADLKGKTIMMAQPVSAVYQMAADHLQRNGLVPGRDVTVISTGTHNNALYAPARREADASVTGILLWSNADPAIRAELVEIDGTRRIPGFMLMANKRVPPEQVKRIQALLLDFEKTEEGKAYFRATDLKNFGLIDDKTMKSLDPFTRILTDPAP